MKQTDTGGAPSADLEVPQAKNGGDPGVFDPAPHRPKRSQQIRVAVALGLVFAALFVIGVVPRWLRHSSTLADEKRAAIAAPKVRVTRVERLNASTRLALPGSVKPLQETTLYARANGFVRKWYVDIGAPVAKGQVLAELDLPDIDDQLLQAQAAAAQAEAAIVQAKTQLELARATNRRYAELGPSGVVSQQEVEQYQARFEVAQSNVVAAQAASQSARANVRRYADLKAFGVIAAPFDGVVTMRAAEVGQLVVSGTGLGQALFKVAEVDTVRVFVNVPQLYAASIRVGADAPTTVREAPGRVFQGKVARTSNELDGTTRTLLTEVDIPNDDRALFSGMYVQVAFDIQRRDQPLSLLSSAVLFDAKGTRSAVVRDGVIRWQRVEIENDSGDRLAIASGLSEGESVALVPSERLVEGMRVDVEDMTSGTHSGATAASVAP